MRIFTGLILGGLLISGDLQAAQDLMHAYEAGLITDQRFQSARYEYEATREAIPQARAGLLPSVSFDLTRAENQQEVFSREQVNIFDPDGGLGKTRYPSESYVLQLSQPVFRLDPWIAVGQSRAAVRQAYALFAAAQQDLILRTAEAYLLVLAARDNLAFTESERASAGQQLDLVQARRRGGLANVTDEYEAKARYSQVEADLILATYAVDDAYQALREVVGDAVTDVFPLQEKIPLVEPDPLDEDDWANQALEQNFVLEAMSEAVAVAEHEVRRRRANHYPTVDLVARHGNSDTGQQVSGSDVDTTTIMLQLTVPIYSGGVVRSQGRQAQMNLRRAVSERELQRRIVARETRAAYQGVRSAIRRVAALRDAVRSQQSALAGRTTGYSSGVSTLLEVLEAERNLYSTQRDLAQARYEYLMNLLRLKEQVSMLDIRDIAHINGLLDRATANAD